MTKTAEKTAEEMLGYASFVVRDIHCERCAGTLEAAVAGLPGVSEAGVDPLIGWTHIRFDPDVISGEELEGAVEAAGYEIVRKWG